MHHSVVKASTAKLEEKGDAACVVAADGTVSNGALHDQIMAGVDEKPLRRASYERMKALGATPEELELLK